MKFTKLQQILALTLLLTVIVVGIEAFEESKFTLISSVVYAGTTLCWNAPLRHSRIDCVVQCAGDNACVSVWHNEQSAACVMCPTVYDVTHDPNGSQWTYTRKAHNVPGKL